MVGCNENWFAVSMHAMTLMIYCGNTDVDIFTQIWDLVEPYIHKDTSRKVVLAKAGETKGAPTY